MVFHKHARLFCAVSMGTLAAACATAPTAEEKAYEAKVKSETIMPASADDRALIKRQDPMTQATFWGLEYEKNPGDVEAATEFAKSLRAIGSDKRAAEIASQTLSLDPGNAELLTLLGKALLKAGDMENAVDALRQAYAANPEDLTVLGALGVAYDQTGRHREAQATYRQILQRNPASTSSLSNLGLSLTLSGEPEAAETFLRRAVEQPNAGVRERQNLAMVLSLLGRFDEARELSAGDLPDSQVDKNIDYFRAMLTPSTRVYGQLRGSMDD